MKGICGQRIDARVIEALVDEIYALLQNVAALTEFKKEVGLTDMCRKGLNLVSS